MIPRPLGLFPGQGALTFAPAVGPRGAQHPLQEALFGLALGGDHFSAQVIEDLGHLIDVVGRRHLAEPALEILGQDVAFVVADLSQVHHVHLIAHQLYRSVALQIRLCPANVIEAAAIGYRIDQQQPVGPLQQFTGIQ